MSSLRPPPAADRALAVPDQGPRHRPERGDQLPPAGQQVLRGPGGDQHRGRPAGVAADHRQHRQLRRRSGLPATDWQRDGREPQVELRDLAGHIGRSRRRIRRQVDRPQLGHPVPQHPDRPVPADPLGDHRCRHRRPRLQQFPDPRLRLIDNRPAQRPVVLRWAIGAQRRPHRVLRDPHDPRDHLDRHLLRPMQPTDLRPVLHCQHPLAPRLGSSQGLGRGSTLRCRQGVSFQAPSTPSSSPIDESQVSGRRELW